MAGMAKLPFADRFAKAFKWMYVNLLYMRKQTKNTKKNKYKTIAEIRMQDDTVMCN